MISNYDLHSHSTCSDGILSPEELVKRAENKGVKTLALTDHDSVKGVEIARAAAKTVGLKLISGVEISTSWGGQTIHLTALNLDIYHPKLEKLLTDINQFRMWRGQKIGEKLEKIGIKNAYQEALKLATGGQLTRTHYGRFLHQAGYVKTHQEAFKKYLLSGKKAHVKGEWASLESVINAVHSAGGLLCVAHPKRYKMTNSKLNRLFAEFEELGGNAIEIVNANATSDVIQYLSQCAEKHQLSGSVGSDFHAPSRFIELGRLRPLPDSCHPIWRDF